MKQRLDVLVVSKGIAKSREQAKALIMAGQIFVDNEREDKPGSQFDENSEITLHGAKLRYVSRGGLKLDKALDSFDINLDKMVCMDVGASTGGFTDCMLQHGASKVYAVDVGYGQFDWKLRQDDRVVCMEKTNIRYVTQDDIDDLIDVASCDVSFISLSKVMPVIYSLLNSDGELIALIKPQFEAGRDKVGKKGVVRDKDVHIDVINDVIQSAIDIGFSVNALDYSPVKGPQGNIEYLIHLTKREASTSKIDVSKVVKSAHSDLNN